MSPVNIKKIDPLYLFAYLFIPAAVCALCIMLSILYVPTGTGAALLCVCPVVLSFVWWFAGGALVVRAQRKRFEKELDAMGFVRNQTFLGRGCTVYVDAGGGGLALLFFWNPFTHYTLPAAAVDKVWVDDGRRGAGVLEGSSYVSFDFTVGGVHVRVYTFTSNARHSMDSGCIQTGIAKADAMARALDTAARASQRAAGRQQTFFGSH